MSEVDPNKFIYLDDYISAEKYTLVDTGVNSFIIPHEGEDHNIYKNLSQVPNLTVFYKKDIPAYWHYANNRRVTPIFVASNFGYRIIRNITDKNLEHGNHGYNNSIKEMHPFFIAHGPAFKKGYQSNSFSIVNIYSLMCHLLEITPAPNNGDLTAVSQMLKKKDSSTIALLIFGLVVAGFVWVIVTCGLICNHKKRTYHFSRIPDLDA